MGMTWEPSWAVLTRGNCPERGFEGLIADKIVRAKLVSGGGLTSHEGEGHMRMLGGADVDVGPGGSATRDLVLSGAPPSYMPR